MTVVVPFSEQEAEYLRDILAWWTEGYEEATKLIERAPLYEEPEQMLDAIDTAHEQFDSAVKMKMRLEACLGG